MSSAISDVVGDEPAYIGSRPTVITGKDSPGAAAAILERYGIAVPEGFMQIATVGVEEASRKDRFQLLCTPAAVLREASQVAWARGIHMWNFGDEIEGNVDDVAAAFMGIARGIAKGNAGLPRPAMLLSGGELTVRLGEHCGKGGPNSQFALSCGIRASGLPVYGLSIDTDGTDGNAGMGGWFGPGLLDGLKEKGLNPESELAGKNAFAALNAIGYACPASPTGTNVSDFRAIFIP